MGAQIEVILIQCIMKPLRAMILEQLQRLILSHKPQKLVLYLLVRRSHTRQGGSGHSLSNIGLRLIYLWAERRRKVIPARVLGQFRKFPFFFFFLQSGILLSETIAIQCMIVNHSLTSVKMGDSC